MERYRTKLAGLSLAALLLFAGSHIAAQSPRAHFEDPAYRNQIVERLEREAEASRQRALSLARSRNLAPKGQTRGDQEFFLQGLGPGGVPLYHVVTTTNAGISTGADLLKQPPFSVDGEGFLVGVWDSARALSTHQEFNQTGVSRAIPGGDGAGVSSHGTATTGVIIAGGVNPGVLGMAPRAVAEGWDSNNDDPEVALRAAASPAQLDRVVISNHAYGFASGWIRGNFGAGFGNYWFGPFWEPDGTGPREDLKFGQYGAEADRLDTILYAAPYLSYFKSSGNDRDDKAPTSGSFFYWDEDIMNWASATVDPATVPFDDGFDGGYDTMLMGASAKNVISIGSVKDAVTSGVRDPGKAAIEPYSGWGPADDGRVKPDLVANGEDVLVPIATGDANYTNTASGTSFSTPNAAGTGLLLLDLARQEFNAILRASSIKALLTHTATDLGFPGPDYSYGWGLPDGEAAGNQILFQRDHPGSWPIVEGLLNPTSPTMTFNINWDGSTSLKASLCWTDPPAGVFPNVVDNTDPALVNDLDLRIVKDDGSETYLPWILDVMNPSTKATRGDNTVDNVEQVLVPAGTSSGNFRVEVSHKGTLTNGSQWFSLVVSGQSTAPPDPFTLTANDPEIGYQDIPVNIALEGGTFFPGTRVLLRRAGFSDREAAGVYTSTGQAFATFNLTGAALGTWDIMAIRPDGPQETLAGGFTVLESVSASITPVSPDPRTAPVDSISIDFTQPVTNFDLADLTLTRNEGANILPGEATLSSTDDQSWTLGNLGSLTSIEGDYKLNLLVSDIEAIANGSPLTGGVTESWEMNTDGVSGAVEDGAPNGGDANNDNIADRLQPNVASIPNAIDGNYITLAVPDPLTLEGVHAVDTPAPGEVDPSSFPVGFIGFTVKGLTSGQSITVDVIYEASLPGTIIDYFKYGEYPGSSGPELYPFPFDGTLGAEFVNSRLVRLHLQDGVIGDDDLTANGEISDDGGPGEDQLTFVELDDFSALATGSQVILEWSTTAETNAIGFDLFLATGPEENLEPGPQINDAIIPAKGSPTQGANYQFVHESALLPGERRWYFLEDLDVNGIANLHGPVLTERAPDQDLWIVH